jgi:prevent-host-death family protein
VEQVGIRELRNQVAAVVRRAAAGERVVVAVDGVPVAQLGPLQPDDAGVTLADQAAAGLVVPPRRPDRPGAAPVAANPPVDVRLDRVLDELRGR